MKEAIWFTPVVFWIWSEGKSKTPVNNFEDYSNGQIKRQLFHGHADNSIFICCSFTESINRGTCIPHCLLGYSNDNIRSSAIKKKTKQRDIIVSVLETLLSYLYNVYYLFHKTNGSLTPSYFNTFWITLKYTRTKVQLDSI